MRQRVEGDRVRVDVRLGVRPAAYDAIWPSSSVTALLPVPLTDWYVSTMTRSMPTASRSAANSGMSCIVEQFGFATMPSCSAASASLTPATTSGTPGSMRHCDELSTTTAPRATASGASCAEVPPPAEKSAMSTPSKASGVATSTGQSRPVERDGPTLRA